MARIILNPNESFEHFHSDASRTIHVDGVICIAFNGTSKIMQENETVHVPAMTPHTITNLGDSSGEVCCVGTRTDSGH